MYDDIAFNEENPRPGVIINSPHGHDVYDGVPKVVFLSLRSLLATKLLFSPSCCGFPFGRIILGKMLLLTTFLRLSLEIELLLQGAVGRLWIVVPMIIFLYIIVIMVVLVCLVSSSLQPFVGCRSSFYKMCILKHQFVLRICHKITSLEVSVQQIKL